MKIEEFINLPLLETPVVRGDKDYFQFINKRFMEFDREFQKVEEVQISRQNYYMQDSYTKIILRFTRQLSQSIRKAVNSVYNGRPAEAYCHLEYGLKNDSVSKMVFKPWTLSDNDALFRLRPAGIKKELSAKEIFHIPITLREKVSTQRFSLPGHPCLYLANSTRLCYQEIDNRSELNYFGSFLQTDGRSKFDLPRLLDLRNRLTEIRETWSSTGQDGKLFQYLASWPLLLATSVRVKYSDDPFKPEYIIPQLLMQYIQMNKRESYLQGIAYSSTKLEQDNELFNVAVPVWGPTKEPYCNVLVDQFNLTAPEKLELNERTDFAKTDSFLKQKELHKLDINGNIISL